MLPESRNSFTPKEFADHFDVAKDTLLYYDRIGLFSPAIRKDNGYRQYTFDQVEPFWALKVLRDADISIKQLQEYFASPSPEGLIDLAAERIEVVDAEIERLKQVRAYLALMEDTARSIERGRKLVGKYSLELSGIENVVYGERNDQPGPTGSGRWENLCIDLLQGHELGLASRIGSVIAREDLASGTFNHIDRVFAVDITAGNAGAVYDPKVVKFRNSLCAVTYHAGPFTEICDIYPGLLQFIEERGYVVSGDAHEEYLSTTLTAVTESEFLAKISIPIRRASA